MDIEKIKQVCINCKAGCCHWGSVCTISERDGILKAGFKDCFLPAEGFYELESQKGECLYLQDSLCSIQEFKPILCKIWPVSPRIVNGKRKDFVFLCPLLPHLSEKYLKQMVKLADNIPDSIYKAMWQIVTPDFPSKISFKEIALDEWLKQQADL